MKRFFKVPGKSTLRTMVIGIVVAAFFVGIVLIYYNMVHEQMRSNIIKDGEMAASKSADQFDRYLATNIDLINFTAYTLNGMLEAGISDEEIGNFLVNQSTAVRNAVQENSTGLYGYINGRFMSGTNWIPLEGYDPTIRPWYTKPMENKGQLTILEPYLDVQSGNTMLALGKTLSDGVSVISVDVSLDQMQKLTEEAVNLGDADLEMILTGDGVVVTHSDISEVGKNYAAETDTLGAQIVALLPDAVDHCFEFDYDDKHYIVYDALFQESWHCISVHDATVSFGRLSGILAGTVGIVILMIFLIGFLMSRYNRQGILAEKAIASNEAKSAFLSNMSHEIRTPINAILGMNEMILRECDNRNILTYSENVKVAGQSLLGIVNDILDFSKIEAGKMEILPVSYDLSSLLNDLMNLVRQRADDKGLSLEPVFDRNLPKALYGDVVRIKQVIANILTNAVKYTEEGRVIFRVDYATDEAALDEVLLKVSVEDTGIGIREEDIGKLFSEFERIDETKNRGIEGTGLGMSITIRLLEMMDSTLNVKSVYGEGSCFSFVIRQKVESWEPLGDYREAFLHAADRHAAYRESFVAPEARILAVDDNPMNLMVFGSLLKRSRIRIETAESGEEALALAMVKKYDLIFLDHMMPGMDGIEVLHELREQRDCPNAETPTVCLTANAISGAREQYLAEGFDDYLSKPMDPEHLEEILLNFLPPEKIEAPDAEETARESASETELSEMLGELPARMGLDLDAGLKNCGSAEGLLSLLRVFYETMEDKAHQIEDSCERGDLKNYTILVHALKSSARIIGATAFGEEAQMLENAGKREDLEYIRRATGLFIGKYRLMGEALATLFAKPEDESDKPVAGEELLSESFAKLRDAAEEMDCDRTFEILDQLENYRIPEDRADLVKALRDAALNYDYEKLGSLLADLPHS